ncbi:MAG: hypothetical protein MK180_13430 [Rhodobacteraceae bacterium]|nr:hypothetical protein [Paracoccaceae bacterium]
MVNDGTATIEQTDGGFNIFFDFDGQASKVFLTDEDAVTFLDALDDDDEDDEVNEDDDSDDAEDDNED